MLHGDVVGLLRAETERSTLVALELREVSWRQESGSIRSSYSIAEASGPPKLVLAWLTIDLCSLLCPLPSSTSPCETCNLAGLRSLHRVLQYTTSSAKWQRRDSGLLDRPKWVKLRRRAARR